MGSGQVHDVAERSGAVFIVDDDWQCLKQHDKPLAPGFFKPFPAFGHDGGVGGFEAPERGHCGLTFGQAMVTEQSSTKPSLASIGESLRLWF